jgi:hypothetical protein
MANDYDFSRFSNDELQGILNRASGVADSIMRKSYLAREQTVRYFGDGSNKIDLQQRPLIYVKRLVLVAPGPGSVTLPISQLLIDYEAGQMQEYTPLLLQGLGTTIVFPRGIPVDVTMAWGYAGTGVVKSPMWTAKDAPGVGMAPGTYNIAVTARTMWGEVPATPQTYETASGVIAVVFTPTLGAYLFRVYASSAQNNTTLSASSLVGATSLTPVSTTGMTAGSQWLLDVGANAEVVTLSGPPADGSVPCAATQFAHASDVAMIPVPTLCAETNLTAFGLTPLEVDLQSLNPTDGLSADPLPTGDTSMPPVPQAIPEATRLLTLDIINEQNNKANQGINQVAEGDKRITWRSTEGTSGRGVSTLYERAAAMLGPYSLRAVY